VTARTLSHHFRTWFCWGTVGLLLLAGLATCLFGLARRSGFDLSGRSRIPPSDVTAGPLGSLIPAQADWTDHGLVLPPGPPGSWDQRLGGQISPCAVVKKGGTFFLYYIGADGDRSGDGGPRHRALGVATSPDGFSFSKYDGNPIIAFLPNNDEEEGIFSCAATLDSNDDVVLYYGAMTSSSPGSVNTDVRLAVSNDGFGFDDLGVVVDHGDPSVWGFGDEVGPLGAFSANGVWHVYYGSFSGYETRWDLGLAWGPSRDNLPDTQAVLTSGSYIIGGTDAVWLDSETIALFIVRDFDLWFVEVRTASVDSPGLLSEPVQIYDFPDFTHATVFLDKDTDTWFMYYYYGDDQFPEIHLKTAPFAGDDVTPPTIIYAAVTNDPTQLKVAFSEPVEEASATDPSNYSIDNDISVFSATLGVDAESVTLTTSPHSPGVLYTLTVNNVLDCAPIPNPIAPDTQVTYFWWRLFLPHVTCNSDGIGQMQEHFGNLYSGS
jgi:hypothetical protein